MKMVRAHDLPEENGKSRRENNMELTHQIGIGQLVETLEGIRLFVTEHRRDCDGTPLYALGANEHSFLYGYGEDSLQEIKKRAVRDLLLLLFWYILCIL